jgi:hypothetical protein
MIISIMVHWAKLAFIFSAAVAYALTCSAAQLRNISGRAGVGTGDNVLITGFTLSSGPSAIIVRALGPSLSAYGIAAPLMDPVLEVHDSTGAVITTNDNWRDTQQKEFGPGGITRHFGQIMNRSRRLQLLYDLAPTPRLCAARMERPASRWPKFTLQRGIRSKTLARVHWLVLVTTR